MRRLASSTDETSRHAATDRAAFVASSDAFVAAFTPQQADALAQVAAWQSSDDEVCSQMRRLAADTDACNFKVASNKEAFVASSDAFAAAFAPQQTDALAQVAAWKRSDEEVVAEMRRLASDADACGARVGGCASARAEQAAAAKAVAARAAQRTAASQAAAARELGLDGSAGLSAAVAAAGARARAKGADLEQQVTQKKTQFFKT
jgi:hypothetical protein